VLRPRSYGKATRSSSPVRGTARGIGLDLWFSRPSRLEQERESGSRSWRTPPAKRVSPAPSDLPRSGDARLVEPRHTPAAPDMGVQPLLLRKFETMQQPFQQTPVVVSGQQVLVRWSDGGEYPARVVEVVRDQARCRFPNGSESWIETAFLRSLEERSLPPPRWMKWATSAVCFLLGGVLFVVGSGGRSSEAAQMQGAVFGGPVLFAALASLFISAGRSLAARIVTIVGVAIAALVGLLFFFEVLWRLL
jgi:hypothetical protein